jgi:LuxR family maltose regulon positive regulatory protein
MMRACIHLTLAATMFNVPEFEPHREPYMSNPLVEQEGQPDESHHPDPSPPVTRERDDAARSGPVPTAGGRPRGLVPRLYPGKTSPPRLPTDAVRRDRLVTRVEASSKPVLVLEAPAGFGKTTTMLQIVEAAQTRGDAVVWLSVDDRDNDFSRFFVYLRSAIYRAGLLMDAEGQDIQALNGSAFSNLRAQAFELLDELELSQQPFVIFLDGFEKIQSPHVVWLVSELMQRATAEQRLVVGARTLKSLPLASLEVRGQLLRLDADLLRFNEAESADFLRKQDRLSLSAQQLHLLHGHTEGWPAAVRLVTLALPHFDDSSKWIESLSSRCGSISQYLAENVLSHLPPEVCQFMLRTSVLENLYGNLCDAVMDMSNSVAMLAEIHRQNLFLALVDTDPVCYEFHSLFRNFLESELNRAQPELVPELHRRAAVFYSSSGRYADAVAHAFKSNDSELTLSIIELCALRFVELGQLETVARWIDALPVEVLKSRLTIQRARAYAMTALHRYDEALDALSRLREAASERGEELDVEATLQLTLMYEWMDRHDLSASEVARMAEHVEPGNQLAFGVSRNMVAYLSFLTGDYERAQQSLTTAKLAYGKNGMGNWPSTYTVCFEGMLEMVQGNTRGAVQRFELALANASSTGQAIPSAFLGDALYNRGDIDRAGGMVEAHLRLNRQIAPPDILILSYRIAARVGFLNGNLDLAENLLTEMGDIGDMRNVPRLKASAWLEKSRLALLSGDLESAARYLTLGSSTKIWGPHNGGRFYAQELDDAEIALARSDLVLGNYESSIRRSEQLLGVAESGGRRLRKIRLQCLLAQAYSRVRRRAGALALLEEALQAGSACELVHIFADEPWFLADLLEELASRPNGLSPEYLQRVRTATDLVAQRMGELVATKAKVELLTLKETAIIRLVADGKANKEVARLLAITDNTVETHLRRIFQKLETRNRTQAVSRARELGVLR